MIGHGLDRLFSGKRRESSSDKDDSIQWSCAGCVPALALFLAAAALVLTRLSPWLWIVAGPMLLLCALGTVGVVYYLLSSWIGPQKSAPSRGSET